MRLPRSTGRRRSIEDYLLLLQGRAVHGIENDLGLGLGG
jgi:hypothetical protein